MDGLRYEAPAPVVCVPCFNLLSFKGGRQQLLLFKINSFSELSTCSLSLWLKASSPSSSLSLSPPSSSSSSSIDEALEMLPLPITTLEQEEEVTSSLSTLPITEDIKSSSS